MTVEQKLQIKVCGMREPTNITEVEKLQPTYMGFIAYPPSKRYVGSDFNMPVNNGTTERVLVVVNEVINSVNNLVTQHNINTVQLHGSETPEMCEQLLKSGKKVWKAFAVDSNFDFGCTKPYEAFCSMFVFDTKGKLPGGNGDKFDWSILKQYKGTTPFLLSGGISLKDVDQIKEFTHPLLKGVDVNSGFESAPAMKKVDELSEFIASIKD